MRASTVRSIFQHFSVWEGLQTPGVVGGLPPLGFFFMTRRGRAGEGVRDPHTLLLPIQAWHPPPWGAVGAVPFPKGPAGIHATVGRPAAALRALVKGAAPGTSHILTSRRKFNFYQLIF